MTEESKALGRQGEKIAVQFLKQHGYQIVEANYKTRGGEIDLIAYDEQTLVFIEVKARRNDTFDHLKWAVDLKKQIRLEKLARYYLYCRGLSDQDCRFDLVLIHADHGKPPKIELIQNAFEVKAG